MVKISATEPDWSREVPVRFWDPGRKLLKTLRDYQRLEKAGGFFKSLRLQMIKWRHWFWSAVAHCELPLNCTIGGGFQMPHPNGIVIFPGAVIGPNCLLMHQTTIGAIKGAAHPPIIGGHVDLGAGAKVLGAVTIGDHAVIGANAVVVKNVAENEIAGGVPAQIIGRRKDAPITA